MVRSGLLRTVLAVVAAGVLAAALWSVVPTLGQSPPRDDYHPLGISPRDATKLTGEKAELWRADLERHERSLLTPLATRPATLPQRPTSVPEPIPSAIIDRPQPFHMYSFRNAYVGTYEGGFLKIWAGYHLDDPSQGLIVVDTGAHRPPGLERDYYSSPQASGPLRIIAVSGDKVEVTSEDGDALQFDLATRRFSGTSALERCCAVQLDLVRGEDGVQAGSGAERDAMLTADIVLSPGVDSLAAFSFKLVYDDTVLAGRVVGDGTGANPMINEVALGTGWNCSLLTGSGTPDTDAERGAGRGVAFLGCFTDVGVSVPAGTRLATFELHATTSGRASIDLVEVVLGDGNGIEIGRCKFADAEDSLTCAGGEFNAR
jgi:hypothetical protein